VLIFCEDFFHLHFVHYDIAVLIFISFVFILDVDNFACLGINLDIENFFIFVTNLNRIKLRILPFAS